MCGNTADGNAPAVSGLQVYGQQRSLNAQLSFFEKEAGQCAPHKELSPADCRKLHVHASHARKMRADMAGETAGCVDR